MSRLPGLTGPKRPSGRVPQSVAWGPNLKPRVGAHLDQQPGHPQLKPLVGTQPDRLQMPRPHRAKAGDHPASRSAPLLPGAQTQSTWVGTHLNHAAGAPTPETLSRRPDLKPPVGAQQDQLLATPAHSPKAWDWLRNPINGLAACK